MEKCLKVIYRSGAECSVRYDDEVFDLFEALKERLRILGEIGYDPFSFYPKKLNIAIRVDQIDHMEILE